MSKLASQIRLDEELFEKVKYIAEKELRSMNAQMEYFILKSVAEYEKENGAIGFVELLDVSVSELPEA